MSKKIFYEKVGRRYKPVYEYDQELLDAFPKGNHLVMCYPGGESRRYNVDPALAPMIAAGRFAETAMLEAMRDACEATPSKQPLTKNQIAAWQQMKEAFKTDLLHVTYPSNHAIVEAGIKAMSEEANKLLEHPSVRDAYNKFLMVCELVKEEKNV